MPFTRASVRILPQEFDSFVDVIRNDPRLPAKYEDWIERIRQQDAFHVANGEVVSEVVVTYEEFVQYCRYAAMEPCYDMLMALTVAKAAGRKA